jgi:hypothetical protein
MRLLRGTKDKPAGLNSATINQWLTGRLQSAVPSYVGYVLAKWSALPTNNRVPLTPEMRALLNAEFARTGTGPVLILKRATDTPQGLTHAVIQTWASDDGDARPNTVNEAYWNYIIARLATMPDCIAVPAQVIPARLVKTRYKGKVEITADELTELHHHRQRTGIGGVFLLRNASDKPAGLTAAMVSAWLSRQTRRAEPGFVAYVLARYRAWP